MGNVGHAIRGWIGTTRGTAVAKAFVVLVPSYGAAWLTGEMVWTIPTLAAATMVATTLEFGERDGSGRVDEGGGTHASAPEGVVDAVPGDGAAYDGV